jgi:outer membrane protein insertion porin family
MRAWAVLSTMVIAFILLLIMRQVIRQNTDAQQRLDSERPRLNNFILKGASKSESDELKIKTGLIKGRVITENMKQTADENIIKYYADKGFQGVEVTISEERDPKTPNSEILTFNIEKGTKVRINQITIYGAEAISPARLKKQMSETHEVTKLTLYPAKDSSSYGVVNPMTFKEYIDQQGFLSYTKAKLLDHVPV